MWGSFVFFAVLLPLFVSCVRIIEPGPKYPPTKGEVWPKPRHEEKKTTYYVLGQNDGFNVTTPYHTCDILNEAVHRLLHHNLVHKHDILRKMSKGYEDQVITRDTSYNGTYTSEKTDFRIELTKKCDDYPHLHMHEDYNLTVREDIVLRSASIWGILRGLESFNHLLYFSDDYSEIRINATHIVDRPAYTYRGILIDTGRHYLEVNTIVTILHAMEMNKMNVLHWHIVDDQSFPYQSQRFPNLSKKGAYHPSMVYGKDDINHIVEVGRRAGIRVIPEFDIPGHVRSWGEAHPEILTECYKKNKSVGLGPLDPTKNETYEFLQQLYQEVMEWFPDEYIHLGGDEVDLSCWKSNPKIRHYMKENKLTPQKLHAQLMDKVKSLLPPQAKSMIWQEVFDEGVPLPNKTLVQVWKYGWIKEMDKMLEADQCIVFSSSWYLDELKLGWEAYFRADPRRMVYSVRPNDTGMESIVGGEACMWGEMVDDSNANSRIWPRASAVAERLWTGLDYRDPLPIDPVSDVARRRIEEHACRMIQRGIDAEPPNGPGFCVRPSTPPLRHTLEWSIHYTVTNV